MSLGRSPALAVLVAVVWLAGSSVSRVADVPLRPEGLARVLALIPGREDASAE